MNAAQAVEYLKNYQGRPLHLMEICGSHTAVLERYAIRDLIAPQIRLVSGPGCPVCVTPESELDRLYQLSMLPGCTLACFADLLRIPGSQGSLQQAMARGGSILTFLSPLDVLPQAAKQPDRLFLVAAIGFETTAPLYARLLDRASAAGLGNIRLISSLRLMPPALEYLFQMPDCPEGFLAPGHVSAIIGSDVYLPLAASSGRSFVIAGFTPEQVLVSLAHLVALAAGGRAEVLNDYPQLVKPQGNILAQAELDRYFETCPMVWRGLGEIPASGLQLKAAFARFAWGESAEVPAAGVRQESPENPPACRCGDVLAGRLVPRECPAFGQACRPEHPLGPCMVSNEGACGLAFMYHQEEKR